MSSDIKVRTLWKVLVDDVHGIRFLIMLLLTAGIYPEGKSALQGILLNIYRAVYARHQVQLSALASFPFRINTEVLIPSMKVYH